MSPTVMAENTLWSDQSIGKYRWGEWEESASSVPPTPQMVMGASEQRPMPLIAVRRYAISAAQAFGVTKQYEDGTWFATANGFDGPWGDGGTEPEALATLMDVIYEWALLKIEDRDGDLPTVPGAFDLNTL